MTGEAVAGPLTGKRLRWIPTEVTTWGEWRARHPATTVLAPPREPRAYEMDPYGRYRETDALSFPLGPVRVPRGRRYKDPVTIVPRPGGARCYPHDALREGVTQDGSLRIVRRGRNVTVEDADGTPVPSMQAYWFAFFAAHPGGTVFGEGG